MAQLEEITHVPQRLRFPFFTEMCWFVLDRYVQCLLGTTHLKLPDEEKKRLKIDNENIDFKVVFTLSVRLHVNMMNHFLSFLLGQARPCSSHKGLQNFHTYFKKAIHFKDSKYVYSFKYFVFKLEVDGLIFLVSYLHCLPASKKNIPEILIDPVKLVQDIRKVVITHRDDCPGIKSMTCFWSLRWPQ